MQGWRKLEYQLHQLLIIKLIEQMKYIEIKLSVILCLMYYKQIFINQAKASAVVGEKCIRLPRLLS